MGLVSSSRRIMTIDKAAVQKIIDSDTVVIFSKSTCPYCTKAKNVSIFNYIIIKIKLFNY